MAKQELVHNDGYTCKFIQCEHWGFNYWHLSKDRQSNSSSVSSNPHSFNGSGNGPQPGVDLDDSAALLDLMDDFDGAARH